MAQETPTTPGPWTITRSHRNEIIEIGPLGMAENDEYEVYLDVSEADAALIKAAPDMLAALKAAQAFVEYAWNNVSMGDYAFEYLEVTQQIVDDALAKARSAE